MTIQRFLVALAIANTALLFLFFTTQNDNGTAEVRPVMKLPVAGGGVSSSCTLEVVDRTFFVGPPRLPARGGPAAGIS